MSVPKVVIPPLAMLGKERVSAEVFFVDDERDVGFEGGGGNAYDTEVIATNHKYVLTSRAVSLTWSHRHFLEAIPIWFALSRSVAMTFSRSDMNLASIGLSGMSQNTKREYATVRRPQKRKI